MRMSIGASSRGARRVPLSCSTSRPTPVLARRDSAKWRASTSVLGAGGAVSAAPANPKAPLARGGPELPWLGGSKTEVLARQREHGCGAIVAVLQPFSAIAAVVGWSGL